MANHDHHHHHAHGGTGSCCSAHAAAPADEAVTRDPVCGMTVDPNAGKPSAEHGGRVFHFCSESCRTKFTAHPESYLTAEDPVCGMKVDRATARHFLRHEGEKFYFCSQGCLDKLNRDELQGVIAHEFSHVLNGDMRLNIRLMGLLFGIMAIWVIGRFLMWGGYFGLGDGEGGGRRRGGSSGQCSRSAPSGCSSGA